MNKNQKLTVLIGAAVAAVTIGVVANVTASSGNDLHGSWADTDSPAGEGVDVPESTVAPSEDPPDPADFIVDLVVIENKCFDSAGALITVEPDLYTDWNGEATVVYEVTGGGADETFSLDLHADGQFNYHQEMVDTDTCVNSLDANVVRVIER